ncbi:MAG: hypothetical protein KDN20_22980 [Verrucomicrobiae bacterium]|nr:hypothetical protein [Verrucomicrobiae bacterium]
MNHQGPGQFPTTHWTLIQSIQEGSPEAAASAFEAICHDYWYPIYAYLRRSGRQPSDAEDLTQIFFERLIANDILQDVRKERGKLRTFLLTILVRLLIDAKRHQSAGKRGGGVEILSFEALNAEDRYRNEPADTDDPEKIYLRAWARNVTETAAAILKETFEKKGKAELYQTLEPFLFEEESKPPYAELAVKLDSTEGAVRLLVHRMRTTYRELFEKEVARTVIRPEDIESELAWLKSTLYGES